MTILDTIVQRKHEEISRQKKKVKESFLYQTQYFGRNTTSMSNNIVNGSGIIAEFKRKSPSKSMSDRPTDVSLITQGYELYGASGISILTDNYFFGGNDKDIIETRENINIPILRKEFIIDPYQIIESKSIGADCILLIAEILDKNQISAFSKIALELGLEIILEIHTAEQINKCNDYIQIIGVNNRNLKTFQTNIYQSKHLYKSLPSEIVKISESGINQVSQVTELQNIGYHGFLIGETFMSNDDPVKTCAEFIHNMKLART